MSEDLKPSLGEELRRLRADFPAASVTARPFVSRGRNRCSIVIEVEDPHDVWLRIEVSAVARVAELIAAADTARQIARELARRASGAVAVPVGSDRDQEGGA